MIISFFQTAVEIIQGKFIEMIIGTPFFIGIIYTFWKSKQDELIRLGSQGRICIFSVEKKIYETVNICAPVKFSFFVGRYINCEFHNCTIDIYRNKFKNCRFKDCNFHYSNDGKFVHFEGEKKIEGEFKFSTNDDVAFMVDTLYRPDIEKLKDEKEFLEQKYKELKEAVEKDITQRNKPIHLEFKTLPTKNNQ